MTRFDEEFAPEFQDLADLMRRERVQATPVELDQLKLQILRRASSGSRNRKVPLMKSRIATLLTIAMLTVGAGGTFALAGGGGDKGDGSGAKTEYHGGKCDGKSASTDCKDDHGGGDDKGGGGGGEHGGGKGHGGKGHGGKGHGHGG
jgi:hypothetical protein